MNGKIVAVLTALFVSACSQQPPAITIAPPAAVASVAPEIGRFQLMQGEYEFVNIKGEGFRQRALFKIDTVTGQLFACSSVQAVFDSQPKQRTACDPFEETHDLVSAKPKS